MSEQVLEPEPGNYSCHIKIELYYIMNKKKWKLFHYHHLRGLFAKPNGKNQFQTSF